MNKRKKLKPVLKGDFRLIGVSPSNKELAEKSGLPLVKDEIHEHQCVDHHIYRSNDGRWNLWGCIRFTSVGRILYHWTADNLTDSNWHKTGEIIRAVRSAGESLDDWNGEEWIQSPFIIKENNEYHMFYGGHGTAVDENGNHVKGDDRKMSCQMCKMTSNDGITWMRYKDENGYSRIFTGPGEARDPCLIKIDGLWHMYHAGYHFANGNEFPGIYVRTSEDLLHWSSWRVVHYDRSESFGKGNWNTECPHVAKRGDFYYLFRTEDYGSARTHVFYSDNPYDFGIGDSKGKYIGLFRITAPEIILDENGDEYITSCHDLTGGVRICGLGWEEI